MAPKYSWKLSTIDATNEFLEKVKRKLQRKNMGIELEMKSNNVFKT